MGRRASRELAMKLLYQTEIQKSNRKEQIERALTENKLTSKDKAYVSEILEGVFDNTEFIDRLIEKYSKGWKINRLSKVDLSILRLSIFEIHYMEDIPVSVSVNEAVELAKKYSGDEMAPFINGILGKLTNLRVLRPSTDE